MLFESINGIPVTKSLVNFSQTLTVHLIAEKTLKPRESAYDSKLKKLAEVIKNSNDEMDHVCIIFENSFPCVDYKYMLFVLDDKFNFNLERSPVINLKSGTYQVEKNKHPICLSMFECWGVDFKIDDEELKMLAFKSNELDKFMNELCEISERLNKPVETIVARICSIEPDYYSFENTFETEFFRENPFIKFKDVHIIVNSTWTKQCVQSLLYVLEDSKVEIEGVIPKLLNARFNLQTDLKTKNALIVSKKYDSNLVLETLNKFENVVVVTETESIKSTNKEVVEFLSDIYEPIISYPKENKYIIQDDFYHISIDKNSYMNISNSPFKAKTYVFSKSNTKDKPDFHYSFKYLKMAARLFSNTVAD